MSNENLVPGVPKRRLQKRDVEGKKVPDQQQQQRNLRAQYELQELNLQAEEAQQDIALGADGEQMDNNQEIDQGQHPYPEVDEPQRPQQDVEVGIESDDDDGIVWIDDGDDGLEQEILRENFFLPYNDHNYDCCDPWMRTVWPEEGLFATIDELDEEGNVTRIKRPTLEEKMAWMNGKD